MPSTVSLRSVVIGLLFFAPAHACSDSAEETGGCAGVGCQSSFDLLTVIDVPLVVVQAADVRVCRNGECEVAKLEVSHGPGKDGRPLPETISARIVLSANTSSPELIYADVVRSGDPNTLYFAVSWVWDWKTRQGAKNDRFDISLESNGATLYETHRVVEKYEIYQPNGSDPPCGGLTCGTASSIDCRSRPDDVLQRQRGVVEADNAPAMCPPLPPDPEADSGM